MGGSGSAARRRGTAGFLAAAALLFVAITALGGGGAGWGTAAVGGSGSVPEFVTVVKAHAPAEASKQGAVVDVAGATRGVWAGYGLEAGSTPAGRDKPDPFSFFTFDPKVDVFVSAGMQSAGAVFDAHVHEALNFAIRSSPAGLAAFPPGAEPFDPACATASPCGGELVVDVGANLGTVTLHAAARGCRVHAFELQRRVWRALSLSVLLNGFDTRPGVTVHHAAVYTEAGKSFTFTGPGAVNPGGTGMAQASEGAVDDRELTTRSVVLDEVLAGEERILFMKVDVEGNEPAVIKSAEGLLRRHAIAHLVVELRAHCHDAVASLYDMGYHCRWTGGDPDENHLQFASGRIVYAGLSREKMLSEVKGMGEDFRDAWCDVASR